VIATEAGHWYSPDGKPVHTVTGRNGKERATTLRDARSMGLLPSVTSIIRMMAAPGLERWKINQVLEAAWDVHQLNVSQGEWNRRVIEQSQKIGKESAERGSQIHGYLEMFFSGDQPLSKEAAEFVYPVVEGITDWSGVDPLEWQAERAFATDMGYGGAVDTYNQPDLEPGIVLDFKTKDFGPEDKEPVGYDEHVMQLAAYRMGLGMEDARCANVFVSRDYPGHHVIYEWSEDEINRGWEMFQCLLGLWRAKKRYAHGS